MIAQYLPFLLSAVTIWMTLMAGNKHPKAWAVGLVNQALWLVWIVSTSAWGLLPMNLALWGVYRRNHFKWDASNKSKPDTFRRFKEWADDKIKWLIHGPGFRDFEHIQAFRRSLAEAISQNRAALKPFDMDGLSSLQIPPPVPKPSRSAIPYGWREVIERARDSIGGGSYSENRQYELSIVGPYLDVLADEFEHLQEVCEAVGQLGLEPVYGDVLPQVGDKVLIHLGRSDRWVEHTVVGCYVWKGLGGDDSLHRVFVRVRSADGYLNARMLKDVRPLISKPEGAAA